MRYRFAGTLTAAIRAKAIAIANAFANQLDIRFEDEDLNEPGFTRTFSIPNEFNMQFTWYPDSESEVLITGLEVIQKGYILRGISASSIQLPGTVRGAYPGAKVGATVPFRGTTPVIHTVAGIGGVVANANVPALASRTKVFVYPDLTSFAVSDAPTNAVYADAHGRMGYAKSGALASFPNTPNSLSFNSMSLAIHSSEFKDSLTSLDIEEQPLSSLSSVTTTLQKFMHTDTKAAYGLQTVRADTGPNPATQNDLIVIDSDFVTNLELLQTVPIANADYSTFVTVTIPNTTITFEYYLVAPDETSPPIIWGGTSHSSYGSYYGFTASSAPDAVVYYIAPSNIVLDEDNPNHIVSATARFYVFITGGSYCVWLDSSQYSSFTISEQLPSDAKNASTLLVEVAADYSGDAYFYAFQKDVYTFESIDFLTTYYYGFEYTIDVGANYYKKITISGGSVAIVGDGPVDTITYGAHTYTREDGFDTSEHSISGVVTFGHYDVSGSWDTYGTYTVSATQTGNFDYTHSVADSSAWASGIGDPPIAAYGSRSAGSLLAARLDYADPNAPPFGIAVVYDPIDEGYREVSGVNATKTSIGVIWAVGTIGAVITDVYTLFFLGSTFLHRTAEATVASVNSVLAGTYSLSKRGSNRIPASLYANTDSTYYSDISPSEFWSAGLGFTASATTPAITGFMPRGGNGLFAEAEPTGFSNASTLKEYWPLEGVDPEFAGTRARSFKLSDDPTTVEDVYDLSRYDTASTNAHCMARAFQQIGDLGDTLTITANNGLVGYLSLFAPSFSGAADGVCIVRLTGDTTSYKSAYKNNLRYRTASTLSALRGEYEIVINNFMSYEDLEHLMFYTPIRSYVIATDSPTDTTPYKSTNQFSYDSPPVVTADAYTVSIALSERGGTYTIPFSAEQSSVSPVYWWFFSDDDIDNSDHDSRVPWITEVAGVSAPQAPMFTSTVGVPIPENLSVTQIVVTAVAIDIGGASQPVSVTLDIAVE